LKKLPKIDYLTNLIKSEELHSISSEEIENYIYAQEKYKELNTIDKLKFIAEGSKLYNPNKIKEENINDVPIELLSTYLRITYPDEERFKNTFFWDLSVADNESIIHDMNTTYQVSDLSPNKLRSNLVPRAVLGHSQKGHGTFSSSRISPNTTIDNILSDEVLIEFVNKKGKPIYTSKEEYLKETQKYINELGFLIDYATNKNDFNRIRKQINKTILGFSFAKEFPIDTYAFLKGIMFGGYFDNYPKVRKQIYNRYGVEIGGGQTRLINKNLVKGLQISITELNSGKFKDPLLKMISPEKRMELFKEIGLIKEEEEIDYKNAKSWNDVIAQSKRIPEGYFQEYVRTKTGPGGSDDILCMISSYLDFEPENNYRDPLWYFWLQIGSRFGDFADTLTKASYYYLPGGQDEALAKYANTSWLKKIRENKYYASNIGVNRKLLEKELSKQGTEEFALILLDKLIDFTATGINPSKRKFNTTKHNSTIHSSAKYFISKQPSSNDYTNFNNGQITKGFTNTFEQELFAVFKSLKKNRANIDYDDKKFIYPLEPSVHIGFHKQPLPMVMEYFYKKIIPIVSDSKNMKKKLEKFFKTY
jgi:hypothetical protein